MNSNHNDLEKIEDGLSKKLIYRKTEKNNTVRSEKFNILELSGFTRIYINILEKFIKNPILTIFSSIIIVIVLFNLYVNFNAGARFSVEGDTNQMTVHTIARGNLSPSQKLEIALDVLGVGSGDEVIVPGFMWISSISAIIRASIIPVLVDSQTKH